MLPKIARAAAILLAASLAYSQSPAFEVASVKSSVPGTQGGRVQFLPGGRFNATNVALNFLIEQAYQVRSFQIVGDRNWMSIIADGYSARYEIQAKGAESATESQVREMVKALLAERFQLKVHRETREMPVYGLIPARSGTKLKAAKDNGRPRGSGGVQFVVPGWIQGTNVAMPMLIRTLSDLVDRPVVDKTSLTDPFDFKLTFTPDSQAVSDGDCPSSFASFQEKRGLKPEPMSCPSIFTAVQDQLGLKLDPQKDPIEVLVIDHAERPSAN